MEQNDYAAELRRAELKSQGLLERISSLTSNYEDEIAKLRVELTLLVERIQQQQTDRPDFEPDDVEYVEGETVE